MGIFVSSQGRISDLSVNKNGPPVHQNENAGLEPEIAIKSKTTINCNDGFLISENLGSFVFGWSKFLFFFLII